MALIKAHDTEVSTGLAFVEMNAQTEAQKMFSLLNNSGLEDHKLKANLTKPCIDHTCRNLLRCPPARLDKNYHQRPLHLVSRLKQGLFQGAWEVLPNDLTLWGWRKPYQSDRSKHPAENTGESLSRMGDGG